MLRDEDGELTPLVIKWAKTQDNAVAESIARSLEAVFEEIGIELSIAEMPFTQMLLHCFRQSERTYGMFYLASNIGYVSDPYYDYHTADEYQGHRNTTGLRDVTLMKLEHDMQKAHPLEMREYTEKWLAFQKRWVELDANNAALLERLLRFLRKQSDGLQHRI